MAVLPCGVGEGAAQPSGFLTIWRSGALTPAKRTCRLFRHALVQKPGKSAQGISTAEGGPSIRPVATGPFRATAWAWRWPLAGNPRADRAAARASARRRTPISFAASIHKAAAVAHSMVLRHVRPLSPEAWEDFVAALERGPTPEQVRAMERAMELTRHMAEPGDEDYEG